MKKVSGKKLIGSKFVLAAFAMGMSIIAVGCGDGAHFDEDTGQLVEASENVEMEAPENSAGATIWTVGNNGSVSCNTYCATGWNNEASLGSQCVAAKRADGLAASCDDSTYPVGLSCQCQAADYVTHGNNGTVSCDAYCEGGTNNEIPKGSTCVSATNGRWDGSAVGLNCTSVPGTSINCGCRAPLPECTKTQYASKAPTVSSDRECTALTVCGADEYESTAPTATTDRVCTALTVCSAGNFREDCTGIVHRPCVPHLCSGCSDPYYEKTAPTPTSDRVCVAKSGVTCDPCTGQVLPYGAASGGLGAKGVAKHCDGARRGNWDVPLCGAHLSWSGQMLMQNGVELRTIN